jgi:hypothetical protein
MEKGWYVDDRPIESSSPKDSSNSKPARPPVKVTHTVRSTSPRSQYRSICLTLRMLQLEPLAKAESLKPRLAHRTSMLN